MNFSARQGTHIPVVCLEVDDVVEVETDDDLVA